jgi:hypothetical protein
VNRAVLAANGGSEIHAASGNTLLLTLLAHVTAGGVADYGSRNCCIAGDERHPAAAGLLDQT